ncbi:MarR family winged helix-turn-helix transcriptional regulator [Labedaea rhizosphaerae]|uniref:MarR family transcriptional regulator n=1 Tax=Labedaea rhizosphaerae TaxID=598644 RepID=A0A4R6SG69_LABRH|nr:MarR family transcriptional regulator [Labedaea rhizosphaerae]TDQ00356.1 MarR family transcriptional regulator [Labedaea rhizosphaerae]
MTQTWPEQPTDDPALAALRVMVAVADRTLEKVTDTLTLTQFRALRTVAERTPVTMGQVAKELGINPSSVTRACERLVALGLVERATNPRNKRETLLAPTAAGCQLLTQVDQDRRRVLTTVLDSMPDDARTAVLRSFAQFARFAESVMPADGADRSR